VKNAKGNKNVKTAFVVRSVAREVALHSTLRIADTEDKHTEMEAGVVQEKQAFGDQEHGIASMVPLHVYSKLI